MAFLEAIGSTSLGSGLRFTHLGNVIPQIRTDYEKRLGDLFEAKPGKEAELAAGRLSKEEYAKWLFSERRRIAYSARLRQGPDALALLEVRDWVKYGVGGRTWNNIYSRAAKTAAGEVFSGIKVDPLDIVIRGATKPSSDISTLAIHGAKLLKKAGPIFTVAGLSMDAHELYQTPPEQRAWVAGRMGSETAGSAVGSGLGVGVCIAFGLVTSGWGLLACGLVGGVGGGYAGERIYESRNPRATITEIQRDGAIHMDALRPLR